MSQPRKHHFIQQAHLALFQADGGALSICGKDGRRFEASAANVFAERDLYAHGSGEDFSVEFERLLARVEGELFPAVEEVATRGLLPRACEEPIKFYMALSVLRNPVVRQAALSMHRHAVHSVMRIMEAKGELERFTGPGELSGKHISELVDEGKVEISIDNSRYLDAFQKMLETQTNLVRAFTLSVLTSPSARVAIGDQPLTYFHPGMDFGAYGPPFGGGNCELTFPISKNICLVGTWGDALPFPASESENAVYQVNRRQAIFATRHLATAHRSKKLEGLMTRYKHICFKTDVSSVPSSNGTMIIMRRNIFPSKQWNRVRNDIRPLLSLL